MQVSQYVGHGQLQQKIYVMDAKKGLARKASKIILWT